MVASRENSSNPGRIPALGLRFLGLIFISILLMYVDNRDNHLDTVRRSVGAALYPVRVIVDGPFVFGIGWAVRQRRAASLNLNLADSRPNDC